MELPCSSTPARKKSPRTRSTSSERVLMSLFRETEESASLLHQRSGQAQEHALGVASDDELFCQQADRAQALNARFLEPPMLTTGHK